MSPTGDKFQLDYILIRRKWRNSLKNVEAYSSFATVGSDHRMVSAKIKLSLRSNKNTAQRRIRYDWKQLQNDAQLQERYTVAVKNKFSVLTPEEESITDSYQRFIIANEEATKECIPELKTSKSKDHRNDTRIERARVKLDTAYNEYQQNTSDTNRASLKQAKTDLYGSYNEVYEEKVSSQIAQIDIAQKDNKYKLTWKLINDLSGRRSSRKGQLEGDTKEERVENWYKHFYGLLGNPPQIKGNVEVDKIYDIQPIDTGPFTKEEFTKAKKAIVEGKASGEDHITPEIIKRCNLDEEILFFCNQALLESKKSEQWSIMNIIPIPKTGDLSKGETTEVSVCVL